MMSKNSIVPFLKDYLIKFLTRPFLLDTNDSSSEISFDQLYDLLSIIREFEPKINIIWGCGIDTRVNKPNLSLILLIGHASEQF